MADYVDSFEELYNILESMACSIESEVRGATLLASFGDRNQSSYGPLVTVLQSGSDELD